MCEPLRPHQPICADAVRSAVAFPVRHRADGDDEAFIMTGHSTRTHLLRLAPAILVAVAIACGPLRRDSRPPAVLAFTNDSFAQADVFIVAQGLGARRIGTVMAGRTDTLVVPSGITDRGGGLNVVARLLGRSYVPQTGLVSILPGERYDVKLSTDGRILSFLPARS
jgi:hypothetical protein